MFGAFRKDNRFLFFIKTAGWLLVFLLLLEVYTRTFVIKDAPQQLIPDLGLVPANDSFSVWGMEGHATTHYLSNGEIYTPYQTGMSVVVLGDSFTEARQVDDDQKFVSVAEEMSHARSEYMDFHNLGLSGRNIADYVYTAPYIKKAYNPAIVVVQVKPQDFKESFRSSLPTYLVPNYFVIKDSALSLIHTGRYFSVNLDFQNAVRASGFASLAIYKIKENPLSFDASMQQTSVKTAAVVKPSMDADLVDAGLVAMQVDALEKSYEGAKVVFLLIPNVPILDGDKLLWENAQDISLMKAINQSSKFPVLYPGNDFYELYSTRGEFARGFPNSFPNRGHLNKYGHYVVGSALAEYLGKITR